MDRKMILSLALAVAVLLCLGLIGIAQPVGSETIQAQTATMGPPMKEVLDRDTPPPH